MTEHHEPDPTVIDDLEHLRRRQMFKAQWASNPEDLYVRTLTEAITMGVGLVDEDNTIVDIGCSSTDPLMTALELLRTNPQVVGIDINQASYDGRRARPFANVVFVCASGDRTTLEPETADLVLMMDSIYRMKDKPAVLREAQRISKPLGLIALKTKQAGLHAPLRYGLEAGIGELVCRWEGNDDARVLRPAEGAEAEDIPALVAQIPGLHIARTIHSPADNYTEITAANIADLIADLKSTSTRTRLPLSKYPLWYEATEQYAVPRIEAEIQKNMTAAGRAVWRDRIAEVLFIMAKR